ncbi:MAG: tetratricopeptide repeat protein [Chlamydiota bacterium]|nr:tetratricopeptide repeat protein [Chlamydiota bacterium]
MKIVSKHLFIPVLFLLIFNGASVDAKWRDEGQSERYMESWQKTHRWEMDAIQGYQYLLGHDFDKAITLFEKALEDGCSLGKVYFQLGLCQHKLDLNDSALKNYQKAIDVLINRKESLATDYLFLSYFNYALICAIDGKNNKALTYFQSASKYNNTEPTVHLNQAVLYGTDGQNAEALSEFKETLRLGLETPFIYHYMARLERAAGNVQSAQTYLDKANALNPDYTFVSPSASSTQIQIGSPMDVASLSPEFLKELESSSNDPAHLTSVGNIYFLQGHYSEAESLYQRVIAEHPEHIEAYAQLGRTLLKLDQQRQGLANLHKASEMDPRNIDYLIYLGESLYEMGRIQKAKTYFEKAYGIEQDNPYLLFYLGVVSEYVGEERYAAGFLADECIRYYQKALELKPDFLEARTNLGNAYARSGHWEEARKEFERASVSAADSAYAHYNLGYIYDELGLRHQSVDEYKKAIDINPDFADAYFNLGYVYSELKLIKASLRLYEKVLSIDREYADAYFNLGVLHDRFLREKTKAFIYYHEYSLRRPNAPRDEKRILKKRILKLYP